MISRASTSFTSDRLLRWRLTHLFNSWDFSPLLCFSFDPGGKRLRAAVKGLYHENFCYWPLGSMSPRRRSSLFFICQIASSWNLMSSPLAKVDRSNHFVCFVPSPRTRPPPPPYPTSLKTSQWNPCLDTSSLKKSWAFSTLKVQTKLEPGRLLKEDSEDAFLFFSSSWKSRFWNQRFASNFCFSSFAENIKKKENENLRIAVFCLIEYFWCLIFFVNFCFFLKPSPPLRLYFFKLSLWDWRCWEK